MERVLRSPFVLDRGTLQPASLSSHRCMVVKGEKGTSTHRNFASLKTRDCLEQDTCRKPESCMVTESPQYPMCML